MIVSYNNDNWVDHMNRKERRHRSKLKTPRVLLAKRVRKTKRISVDFRGGKLRYAQRIIAFYFELLFKVDTHKQKKKRFNTFDTERRR